MSKQKRQPCPKTEALGEHLGKTIQRLRTAGNLSLGDLSEMSGVAKSMISQIEKNESNPTLATLSRLSQALGTSVGAVLTDPDSPTNLVEQINTKDTPVLRSEDELCELRIIGWIRTVEWVQWYDFRAKPGGRLESSPHPAGSVENLTILKGTLQISVDGECWTGTAGRTFRYRADRPHVIENIGDEDAHATMVNILAHSVNSA